jgi:hypothetical protein
MVLAGLRGYAGCEILALSNWIFGRSDMIACAPFTPIDYIERKQMSLDASPYEC